MRRKIPILFALLVAGLGASGRAEAGLVAGQILVSDVGDSAIVAVNPNTGARTVFSESGVAGAGVALSSPQGIAIDSLGFIVVADSGLNAIVRIDETTGDRTILSSLGTQGSGLGFNNPIGITTNRAGSIFVADQGGFTGVSQIFEVNAVTGNRMLVSGNGLGSGSDFDNVGGIAYIGGQLIVTDSGDFATASSIFSVDPISGNRTLISTGQNLDNVRGVTAGPAGSVQTVDAGGGFPGFAGPPGVVNVAVGSGSQTPISGGSAAIGTGPSFANPYDVATGINGLLYVTDAGDFLSGVPTQLFSVDPTTGVRTVVSGGGVGSGTAFGQLGFGIAVVPQPITRTTIPEPATVLLLGQCLVFAGFAAIRRRRSKP